MKIKTFLMFVCVFLFIGLLMADEWKAMGSDQAQAANVKVLSATAQEVRVEITVPGYLQRPVDIDGKKMFADFYSQ